MNAWLLKALEIFYLPIEFARSDIRNRFRGSKIGVFWFFLNPLLQTGLFTLFYSAFRGSFDHTYPLYVLSGFLIWDVITSSIITGCGAFHYAEGYINNFKFNIVVYLARIPVYVLFTFFCHGALLLLFTLVFDASKFFPAFIAILAVAPFVFIISFSLVSTFAYGGLISRDLPNVMGHILQAVWFISPVFIWKGFFADNFTELLTYNPVYYLLNLVRVPLFEYKVPTITDVGVSLFFVVPFAVCGWFLHKALKKNVGLRL